jgi:hypothetical protein
MGGLETALVVLGLAGVAGFTSLALFLAERIGIRKSQGTVELPEVAALVQPTDVPLKVRVLRGTDVHSGTTIEVSGVADRLTLRKERPAEHPPAHLRTKMFEDDGSIPLPPAPELEIGDDEFDRSFFVLGPPTLVYALLDAETRRVLKKLTASHRAGGVEIEQGRLQLHEPGSEGLRPEPVERCARDAVALARRLLPPADMARRLCENAQKDPLPAVRLNNLRAAIREAPGSAQTRAALMAATGDRDTSVRLRAGLALGADGRDALVSVADSDAAGDTEVETALEALGADVPVVLVARVLRRSVGVNLDRPPSLPRAARACVAALARAPAADAISLLQALLLASASLADDAARVLGRIGGPDAEAALIGALEGEVPEGRLAAARLLGDVGSAAAVVALREAEARGGELRKAARQAIADIQSRLAAAPGAVSLSGSEAGQVSMVEDPSGRVSLPPAKVREGA